MTDDEKRGKQQKPTRTKEVIRRGAGILNHSDTFKNGEPLVGFRCCGASNSGN